VGPLLVQPEAQRLKGLGAVAPTHFRVVLAEKLVLQHLSPVDDALQVPEREIQVEGNGPHRPGRLQVRHCSSIAARSNWCHRQAPPAALSRRSTHLRWAANSSAEARTTFSRGRSAARRRTPLLVSCSIPAPPPLSKLRVA